MTLPANIRLNMNVPFPALVQGDGPITIGKVNGIWTIGFDITLVDFVRKQRSILNIDDLPILFADSILNVNLTAPLVITLPAFASRLGAPLTFIDVGGTWGGANTPTFATTDGDTISGLASGILTGTNSRQVFTFMPMNDGVNAGYSIV